MRFRFSWRPGAARRSAGDAAPPEDPDGLDDHRPRSAGEPRDAPPGVPVPPVVVPRWIQLVLLPLALLGLWALARAAGVVLLILLAASTIALILNPLVRMLVKRGFPRALAILTVFLGGSAGWAWSWPTRSAPRSAT